MQLFLIVCLVVGSLIAEEQLIPKEALFDFRAECLYASPIFSPKENSTFLPQVPKVNLITGEYCEDACDLVIAGIEPISIRRFYNHFSSDPIYGHWRINPETFMLFNFEAVGACKTFAAVGERNSCFFLYEHSIASGFALDISKNKSFTNASSTLTGQSHPLNTRISYTKGLHVCKRGCRLTDYYWWEGTIQDGSGRERLFKTDVKNWPQAGKPWPCLEHHHPCSGEITRRSLAFTPPYQTQITEERRPNGNVIRYEYEDWNASNPLFDKELSTTYILKSIHAYSQKGLPLGSVQITYETQYPFNDVQLTKLVDAVHFTGSDGRKATFTQSQRVIKKRVAYDTTLSQVTASGNPIQTYNYHHNLNKKRDSYTSPPYLYQVCQPERRSFETSYDGSGKVAAQSAPIGLQGELCPIARYIYESDHTIVYDGENNKTLYRFNADKRITTVEKYRGEQLDSIDKSAWDPKTGNLLKRRLEDAAGSLFYSAEYIYDKNHNVIEERVEGSAPIFRTYSDDGFNLKLSESDRPNKETRYTYLPQTNLLASEIVRLHGAIAKRTFHFYDSEIGSICVKTSIDDGTSEDPNDLTGVTFRHVTEMVPKRTLPCMGLPEEVREYAGDKLLNKVCYTYHPSGQIVSEEHYDADNTYRFTLYNEYDAQERLVSTTDALGNTTTFTYDSNFNLISQQGPRSDQYKEWSYDLANRPIQEREWQSDGTILISEQRYDRASRLIATVDPSGFETCYTYDSLGRVIAIYYPDGALERKEYDILGNVTQETDPNGYITRKVYNFGRPTAIYHPDGTEEHFTYNEIGGTLASHMDIHGVKTLYAYDLFDNIIRTETASAIMTAVYSPFCLLSKTDSTGETTFLTYDLVGRKIGERKGKRTLSFAYNAQGQLSQTKEGDVITCLSYDLKGQLLEKRIEGAFQEDYTYDEAGNKITTTTCSGTTHTTYNSRGQPIHITDPLGNAKTMSYAKGLIHTICDPQGITKIIIHDSRGRPIDLQTRNQAGELIQREERNYDLAGHHIHAIESIYEGTLLQKTMIHEWHYGPRGRLERLLEAGLKETRYLYDHLGRLCTLVKPDGRHIQHSYDDLSRLARYYGEGIDYAYTYDCKNRLTTINDRLNNTTLERVYDLYDNIISEKLDSGIILHREFDPYGRRIALHLPDASSVMYHYKGPYLHTVSHNQMTHTYAKRNLSGRPTHIILPNQGTISIDYDPLLRWKNYTTPHFQTAYTYDSVGNLTNYHYKDPMGTEELFYQYDDLQQLLSENKHTYTYDSLYNRTSKDHNDYALNALFQITDDGQHEYCYDKNGNLLSDGLHTYAYDLLDRLITVTTKKKRTHYRYDALNRRISKNEELYIWDHQQEIGMMRNNKIQELRILGEGKGAEIGAAVFLKLNGISYIPIHDHRGSLVTLLTAKGMPQNTHRYTAFGEELTCRALSPWRFSSKRHDPESGLIYFGRRYYHPVLGRWITSDPQGFHDGPNLYAYVHNNPLLYCDPYGLRANSFAETRNLGEFCGRASYHAFRAIELIGHHLIPLPGLRDLIETAGRFGRGGNLFMEREYARVLSTSGWQGPHSSVIYSNGVLNNKTCALNTGEELSKEFHGVRIDILFKPSHGFSCDLIDALIAKCGVETAYVRLCAHYFTSKLEADPDHQFDAIVHSHGTTNLNNVSKAFNKDEGNHIKVHAFGGATIISEGHFNAVRNYASKLDLVPWSSPWGLMRNILGLDSNVTFLPPTSCNPLTEHGILGDTYRKELEKIGNDYYLQYSRD